jgi:hypothetical protein
MLLDYQVALEGSVIESLDIMSVSWLSAFGFTLAQKDMLWIPA